MDEAARESFEEDGAVEEVVHATEVEETVGLLDSSRRARFDIEVAKPTTSNVDVQDGKFRVLFGTKEFERETMELLKLAIPTSAMNLLSFAVTTLSLLFVGRVSTLDLSGILLANSIFNVTGISLVVGLASGMETLCSQAFGAQHYVLVGVLLQRALVLVGMLCVVLSVSWLGCYPVLIWIGQEEAVAEIASKCVLCLIPGLFGVALFFCLRTYLAMQSIVLPAMYVTSVGSIFSISFNYVLVMVFHLGAVGSAMATSVTFIAEGSMLLWYVQRMHRGTKGTAKCTWGGWTQDALHGWTEYLVVAMPSAAMLCLEWWVFEIAVAMAGLLSNPEVSVAAFGIGYQTLTLSFAIPYGMSSASATRVGMFLGKGQPRAAILSVHASLLITFVVQLFLSMAVVLLRHSIGSFFSSEQVVVQAVAGVIPFVAGAILGDGFNATMSGVLRGAGRQKLGFYINFVVFYLVALPLSWLAGFHLDHGIQGLWLGLLVGLWIQPVCLFFIMLLLDWGKEARRAFQVVARQEDSPDLVQAANGVDHGDESGTAL